MSENLKPGNFNAPYFNHGPGKKLKTLLFFSPAVLIALLFLVVYIVPLPLKRDSKESVVSPINKPDKGFVGKTNMLLEELLLECEDCSVRVTSVESLTKRYPAFEFQLPYEELAGSNVQDVRVVGINPDYIKTESLKTFYYNSAISSLLRKQRENMMEKYFSIDFKREKVGRDAYESRVSKIYLKKDMFKIALAKDPWQGTITSAPNSLFDDGNSLYLVHKDMMVPLSKVANFNSLNKYTAVFGLEDETFYDSRGNQLDYYQYYKSAFKSSRNHLRVDVRKTPKAESMGWVDIAWIGDSGEIQIVPNKNLICRVATPGEGMITINSSELANATGKRVAYKEGMRVLLYDRSNAKVAEFAIVSENPMQILSTMRHTDEGLSRYWANSKNADILSRQMAKGVGRNMSNALGVDTVKLSIDPMLSLEFEKEMKKYIKSLKSAGFTHIEGEQFEMSLTIMDMATGEIIASPSVTDNPVADDRYLMAKRNSSFVRRPVGSSFKPLLTLSAVLANPSLLKLQNTYGKSHLSGSDYKGKPMGEFLGRTTLAWVPNHWGNNRNMTQYLAHSDDVYPVLLTALSLIGRPDSEDLTNINTLPVSGSSYFRAGSDGVVLGNDNVRLTDYEMIKNMASLYEVYSFHETDIDESENINHYLWESLYSDSEYLPDMDMLFGLEEVSPDATNMRYDRFEDNTLRGHLVSWVLGQGDNDWSALKFAEAWTRMLTKQPVRASFVSTKGVKKEENESLVDRIAAQKKDSGSSMSKASVNSTWNTFLANFKDAQSVPGGTLNPMYSAFSSMNSKVKPASGNLMVFSKTGTPDQYSRMEVMRVGRAVSYYDVAQFAFSLMPESSYKSVQNGGEVKGITCVVRITRSYPKKSGDSGLWSSHARDFFSANAGRLEKLYYMTQKYY